MSPAAHAYVSFEHPCVSSFHPLQKYTEAVTLSPDWPVLYVNRGMAARKKGDWERVEVRGTGTGGTGGTGDGCAGIGMDCLGGVAVGALSLGSKRRVLRWWR